MALGLNLLEVECQYCDWLGEEQGTFQGAAFEEFVWTCPTCDAVNETPCDPFGIDPDGDRD